MPRYFITVVYTDRGEITDPKGTQFKDDTAVIEAARRVIDDLRAARRPDDPKPTVVVRNEAGEVIYRFPSN
jgi:hypothetical protein